MEQYDANTITIARRTGFHPWVNVMHEKTALSIRDRLAAEQPGADPNIGLFHDGTFVVWYKPTGCTWTNTQSTRGKIG